MGLLRKMKEREADLARVSRIWLSGPLPNMWGLNGTASSPCEEDNEKSLTAYALCLVKDFVSSTVQSR